MLSIYPIKHTTNFQKHISYYKYIPNDWSMLIDVDVKYQLYDDEYLEIPYIREDTITQKLKSTQTNINEIAIYTLNESSIPL